ncbi:MAG: hypothetical protein ACREOG_23150, partial [Gemmatimonadaceae bacterium]
MNRVFLRGTAACLVVLAVIACDPYQSAGPSPRQADLPNTATLGAVSSSVAALVRKLAVERGIPPLDAAPRVRPALVA